LLTNMAKCPQMQADNVHSFERTDFIAKAVHIERYINRGWVGAFIQPFIFKNVAFLLRSCCSSLFSDDFLSHSRSLALRWNKRKLLCTIKMLSDLFHSNPEGSEAIYR
jgi:hypothetical protein